MKKLIIIIAVILGFHNAFAQEHYNELQSKILNQLDLKPDQINQDLYVEKVLPYAEDQIVAVVPKISDKDEDDGWYEYDSYIIVADKQSGKILQQFYEKDAWTSDAVRLTEISIDTGLYILNSATRAFGIRVHYTGSSRPNPYGHTDLSLFMPKNNTLKRILKNYSVSDYSGEWDTKCTGEFQNESSSVSIDRKNIHNGFYDLKIKNSIKRIKSFPVNDDCKEKITERHTFKILKYNGEEYR